MKFCKVVLDQLDKVMLKWIINVYDPKDSSLNIHSNIYYVNDEDVKNTLCVPVVGQTITLDASY